MTRVLDEIEQIGAGTSEVLDTRALTDMRPSEWVLTSFWALCRMHRLAAVAQGEWKSSATMDQVCGDLGAEIVAAHAQDNQVGVCLRFVHDAVVYLHGPQRSGTGDVGFWAWAAARTLADARTIMERMASLLPPVSTEEASTVLMPFWTLTGGGPREVSRKVGVFDWAAIRDNYAASTAGALDRLMAVRPPAESG